MITLTESFQQYKDAQARVEEARAAFLSALQDARGTRTLEEIGRELGLSRQRVHGILKAAATHARAQDS